ncbi:MAG: flagellar hook assembly protein FlgD [Alphaproteobacteria bacterium]|nr:flagellar hook assembly protein FlgD [Alphaproteobacteria bacterium]
MALLDGTTSATSATSSSVAAQSEKKLKDDLNKFLNLLVTQLKHQDPLDPMDATELTSQLVQFASVEQQIHQNANLEKLIALQQGSQISSLVNYIGMKVEAGGQKVPLEGDAAKFTYTLPAGVAKGDFNIINDKGVSVYAKDTQTTAGKHTFIWDGRDKNGVKQVDGDYTVVVTAQDREGKILPVEYTVFGRVGGASAESGNVSLFMGKNIQVPMDQIKSVTE